MNVHGLTVTHGALIHANRHGAVLIPPGAAEQLPRAIDVMTRREGLILEAARRRGFSVDDLRRAMAAGDDIH